MFYYLYICIMLQNAHDISYLCSKMSDMSGLPIRIYKDNILLEFYSIVPFPADPASRYETQFFGMSDHISYYNAPDSSYYGVMTLDKIRIVIGPSFTHTPTNQELHDMAYAMNISGRDFEAFRASMRTLVPMPLDSIIQMMCTLNHVFTGEKLNVSDLQIHEARITEKFNFEAPVTTSDNYRSYAVEKQISDIVRSGDTDALEMWAKEAPTVRGGTMSSNSLRQNKDTLIVSVTLLSRTAISCGVDVDDAFKLSDSLILRCENAKDMETVNQLHYEAVYTFTKEVGKRRSLSVDGGLRSQVYNYIVHHLSEAASTADIANSLYLSRSRLSTLFKKTYGENLIDFIHRVKIEHAKELLKDRTKTILQISDYLGYSSGSHFNRVFRSVTGMAPLYYRNHV